MKQHEKLFEFGAERGHTTLFQFIHEDGSLKYYTQGRYMQDDLEDWKEITQIVDNLEDYIHNFLNEKYWYGFIPQYIHPDLISFFRKALREISKDDLVIQSHSHSANRWLELIH